MTRQNILKVAAEEFSKYGYDAVSMNNLAAKLQVNKATIYYHFKDKKSLYQEILTTLIKINREQNEKIVNSDAQAKEKLKQYIMLFIKTTKENPQIVPISLREMANLGANIDNEISLELEHEMLYLKQIILSLNLKDKYKDLDFYELKAMLMGTINSYYSMQMSHIDFKGMKDFSRNSDDILDSIGEFIVNIFIDALCKD